MTMGLPADWTDILELTGILGTSERHARRLVLGAMKTGELRDCPVDVRTAPAHGAPGGKKYQVRRARPSDLPSPVEPRSNVALPPVIVPTSATREERFHAWSEWREQVIAPAAALPPGSRERGDMLDAIASRPITWPSGRVKRVGVSTLRGWLRAYEARGQAGIERKVRADAGRSHVHVSRKWDAAMRAAGIDDPTMASIAATLREKSSWAWQQGAPSWRTVAVIVRAELVKHTEATGYKASRQAIRALCRVPRGFVEADPRDKAIADRYHDAKRFADFHGPRAIRSRAGMAFGDLVVGDVHPLDIMARRPDGSEVWPRMIAWQDAATNAIYATVLLLDKGREVRQVDVIESFIDMACAWGLPRAIYIDNGSEYRWTDLLGGVRRLKEIRIIRSLPYNAAAKIIEGTFGNLERFHLSLIPGWAGGDREYKRTANVGEKRKPYPGDAYALKRDVQAAIECYHATEQRGHLNGLSPREAMRAMMPEKPQVFVERHVLEEAIAKVEYRVVKHGAITIDGTAYANDELSVLSGERVACRIPLAGADLDRIAVLVDGRSEPIFAERVPVFGFLDPAGARFKGERTKRRNKQLAARRVNAAGKSLFDAVREAHANDEPAPAIEGQLVQIDPEIHTVAEARCKLPPPEAAPVSSNPSVDYWASFGARRRNGGAEGA